MPDPSPLAKQLAAAVFAMGGPTWKVHRVNYVGLDRDGSEVCFGAVSESYIARELDAELQRYLNTDKGRKDMREAITRAFWATQNNEVSG